MSGPAGAWVAYHSDFSDLVVFPAYEQGAELAAYKHAVENSMQVVWVEHGQSVQEAVSAQ